MADHSYAYDSKYYSLLKLSNVLTHLISLKKYSYCVFYCLKTYIDFLNYM